jgi:hypothetical protein
MKLLLVLPGVLFFVWLVWPRDGEERGRSRRAVSSRSGIGAAAGGTGAFGAGSSGGADGFDAAAGAGGLTDTSTSGVDGGGL